MKKFGSDSIRWLLTSLSAVVLVACGGGGGGGGEKPSTGNKTPTQVAQVTYPTDDNDARRFLTQATFGPTDDDVAELNTLGFEPWIAAQIAQAQKYPHTAYFDDRDKAMQVASGSSAGFGEVVQSFWYSAMKSPDQLRQRVAFALSEIFVVSGADGCATNNPRGAAGYYDLLADNAFGNFRTLLEKVALHPVMGCYLSSLRNQRENSATGRVPDENFAREILQLFSIGLYKLNLDGSLSLNDRKEPIETYNSEDVAGLAKVFTGLSFDCPDWPADSCFYWGHKDNIKYSDMWNRQMVWYPQYHSYSGDKSFLGKTIKATARPMPEADIKEALDWIAQQHPNVGPFIGKQLIQRLVTSNPSPAYVGRVAAAFEASGRNLGEMVRAILLDPEARDNVYAMNDSNNFGKVREPIMKLTAFMRAFGAISDSGFYMIQQTDDASTLSQTPLKAPSVFNYFRPGYVFPGGASEARGLVAPELQIANESSIAGYVSFLKSAIQIGFGRYSSVTTRYDVQFPFNLSTSNYWYLKAAQRDSEELVKEIGQKLACGSLSESLRTEITAAVNSISLSQVPNPTEVKNRLWSAMLLVAASPEYQIQK